MKTFVMADPADDLFRRHALAVYRYFRRVTGRVDVAEDLTQDVFLRIVRGIERYEARDREVAWVFRIARNVLADHWQDGDASEVALADVEEPAAEASHVVALGFHEALGLLPPVDRQVYLLRERGGLTYQEIARTCEMTEEAVRSRLYRVRREIKRLLTTRLSTNGQDVG